MNSPSVKFAVCALSLHYLAFMVFLHEPFHKFETTESISRFDKPLAPLTIRVVSDQRIESQSQLPEAIATPLVSDRNAMTPILLAKQTEEMVSNREIISERPEEIELSASASEQYFHTDQLTRMPTPLTEIDLDVPELKEVSVVGQVDLTLLIEASGVVSEVISTAKTDELRVFSERVIERFKHARFLPGEINGKAVRAQLQITVISEDIFARNRPPVNLSQN